MIILLNRMRRTLLMGTALLLCALAPALPASEGFESPRAAGIASANKQATAAGFEILAQGGNAFDAAVAVSAALSVVEPESSGLGGGGFFLLHRASDGKAVFVDAREKAPLAATRDMYLDTAGNPQRERSVNGPLAGGIPGLPAGLVLVAERYGKLPLQQSLAPAIRLARQGYTWSDKNAAMIGFRAEQLAKSPGAAALFLPGGKPPKAGTRIRNRDIAAVLERLASDGHAGFYAGQTARTLVAGVRKAGGIWSDEDFAAYEAVEREPLRFDYRGQTILTAPPPSSGGIALVGLFQILAGYPLADFDRVARLHVEIEAMRRVYRDRAIYLGDPDFVQMPLEMLLSPYYAAGLRASIHTAKATPSAALPGISAGPEGNDTSHFSIIDADGQCRSGHPERQPALRRRLRGARHRLRDQQRDGRFLGQARRAQRLRPDRRGRQRHRTGQAPVVVDVADHPARQRARRGDWLAGRQPHHHHGVPGPVADPRWQIRQRGGRLPRASTTSTSPTASPPNPAP
jgi:gamma-glutamyltranspeptidase/glutathione hydrolase